MEANNFTFLIQEVLPSRSPNIIRLTYRRVAEGTFIFALIFNSFLIWLIKTKTPAPMLVYSKLLLAPCFMDIFIAICTFMTQPISIIDHGYFGIVQYGFFRNLPPLYNYSVQIMTTYIWANVLWLQMLLLFLCCTTIQFIFRYYMISSDGTIPNKVKYLTGLVLIILLIAHIALHYVSDYPFEEKHTAMLNLAKLVEKKIGLTEIRFSSFTYAPARVWIFHCVVMVALFGTCYGIIIFCTMGTRRYISKTTELTVQDGMADRGKKSKMRDYNQQVTRALLIQAILPTMDVIVLAIQTITPIFLHEMDTIKYMIYSTIPLYFIPVLNPLASIILVKPYRKAFLKVLDIVNARVDTSLNHHSRAANLRTTIAATV